MPANRTDTVPAIWAQEAVELPVGPPVAGTTYRKAGIEPATVQAGWPFATIQNSAEFNEVMRRVTAVLMQAEAWGIIPWCATIAYAASARVMGSNGKIYKARTATTNNDPVVSPTQWEDTETTWSTGDAKVTFKTVADVGWIMANDGTIGSAASAATTRANADCQALFTLLWTNVSNTYAPVTGERGASAAADWAANKVIKIGSILGRALGVAGAGASLTARALGQPLGEENHTLSETAMPYHAHLVDGIGGGSGARSHNDSSGNYKHLGYNHFGTSYTGGSGGHNNMQPTTFLNLMIKL